VTTIRTLSMDAVQRANSGHPGTPMALAPLAHVLFSRVMRHNPANPDWPDRDRFVLSAGHASMLLYSMLYLTGYGLTLEDIRNFRQLESPTAGHPERKYAAGIETTTGPLGQGISTAVGLALAERMLAARFNSDGHDLVGHHTFTIVSDGDLQEGIASEACSLAGHLGVGGLVAFYDDNHISIEGDTALSFSEDVGARFEAYGWHVENLGEETDLDALEAAARRAMAVEDRPSLVIVRTHIAQGAPNKQDTAGAHGSPLGEEEVRLTKEAYGWPTDEPFRVPEEVLDHYRAVRERGAEAEAEWNEVASRYAEAFPETWETFRTGAEGLMPGGWDQEGPPRFEALDETGDEGRSIATRKASETVLQWAAAQVPLLVGGSADLAPSNNTLIAGAEGVERGAYAGRNLHFGIREHAMGAVVNGLTLHGFRAYGATFLIFSDYMRGSIRLAALMKLPSIFVLTHDSIGLGEDGPTHQPVEQLPGLRAVPRLCVLRPADANETARSWEFALARTDRPSALVLSRQALPVLDPDAMPADAVDRGAYVLREAASAEPELILIGTGAEVHLCLAAAERLEADGIPTRVVSMPCVERFAEQDTGYRDEVLPPEVRARVAVEAAGRLGWDRWVADGEVHAMESFGESGKAGALFEHFGFTPARVAERGRSVVERVGATAGRA
jgi:transketolase